MLSNESDEDGEGRGVEKPKTSVEGGVECVAMIGETNFVSEGDTRYVFVSSTY